MTQTPPENPAPTPKAVILFNLLAVTAAVLAFCVVAWRGPAFNFFSYDDAYIGLRYVANFLHTGHFEWNIGEAVEGYTDPLRLLLIAGFGVFGMDLLEAARLINTLAVGGFALLIFWIMHKRLGWMAALFPAGLAACNTPMIAWVWGALDPPLTVFIIACAQAAMLEIFTNPEKRNARWAAISAACFAAALLVRLDSALYAVPAALAWWVLDGKGKKNFLIFCGIIGGVVAAQMALRLAMYGEFLPNTFYNKVMGTPGATFMTGLTYIYNGLKEYPFYYAGGLAAMLLLAIFRKPYRAFVLYAFGGIFLSALYVAAVGGDFMPGFRFLMPWLPVCLIAVALLMEIPSQPGKGAQVMRYTGFLVGALLLKACFTLPHDLTSIDGTAVAGLHSGRYIATTWPKGSLIALNAAGVIPYVNLDKNFIDMLGLNDKHIARRVMPDHGLPWQKKPGHGKGDGAYVLSRKPDYIILSSIAGDNGRDTPVFASDHELKQLPEFKRCYKNHVQNIAWQQLVSDKGRVGLEVLEFPFSYYKRTCKK